MFKIPVMNLTKKGLGTKVQYLIDTLAIEAKVYSEMSIPVYQTTCQHNPDELIPRDHCWNNLKSLIMFLSLAVFLLS
jgi:hypothetical protein